MGIDFKQMNELTTKVSSKLDVLKKKSGTEPLSSSDHLEFNSCITSLTHFICWPYPGSEVKSSPYAFGDFADFEGNWTYLRQQELKNQTWISASEAANALIKEAEQFLKDHPIKYTAEELEMQKKQAEYKSQYNALMGNFRLFKNLARIGHQWMFPKKMDESQKVILDAKAKLELLEVPSGLYIGNPSYDFAEIDEYFKQYDLENSKHSNQPTAIVPMYEAAVAVANVQNAPVVVAPVPAVQIAAIQNAVEPH